MNSKTYRVSEKTAEKIKERNIKYVKENKEIIPESRLVSALIEIGIKREKENDIESWIEENK